MLTPFCLKLSSNAQKSFLSWSISISRILGEIIIIEIALIEQLTHSETVTFILVWIQQCCVYCDIGLVTCDICRLLIVCSIFVKKPRLFRYYFNPCVAYGQHAVTILDIVLGFQHFVFVWQKQNKKQKQKHKTNKIKIQSYFLRPLTIYS